MIRIVEETRQKPVCPHCETEIVTVLTTKLAGFLGVRYIYYCEHCRKTLGISHRKGFWMG